MTFIRHLVRLPYMFHIPPKNTQNFRFKLPIIPEEPLKCDKLPTIPKPLKCDKLPTIPEEPLKCDECILHNHTYECFRRCKRCKKTYTRYICDNCILKFNMCENCKNKNDIEFNIMAKVISNKLSEFFDFRIK